MGSGDRDIIHSDLALMASSHSELTMLLSKGHDMDRATRVFLKRQRLHHDVVLRVCWRLYVYQPIDSIFGLEEVGVGVLAELTLEIAPEERGYLRCLLALHL